MRPAAALRQRRRQAVRPSATQRDPLAGGRRLARRPGQHCAQGHAPPPNTHPPTRPPARRSPGGAAAAGAAGAGHRAPPQDTYAARLAPLLLEAGARPLWLPAIAVGPLSAAAPRAARAAALRDLGSYDIRAFTSRNGMAAVLAALGEEVGAEGGGGGPRAAAAAIAASGVAVWALGGYRQGRAGEVLALSLYIYAWPQQSKCSI